MRNFDNYNNEIRKIKLDEKRDKEILNNVINNKKVKHFNLKYACTIAVIFISFIGKSNAEEIAKNWKIVFPVAENVDYVGDTEFVFPKTNFDDADVWSLDIDGNYNTLEEIEDLIGVKEILKLDEANDISLMTPNRVVGDSNVYVLRVSQSFNENKYSDDYTNTINSYDLIARVYTKHAYKYVNHPSAFELFGDIIIGKTIVDEYYIESLDTTAVIYTYTGGNRISATFVYNNIQYDLMLLKNDIDEIKNILNKLHE